MRPQASIHELAGVRNEAQRGDAASHSRHRQALRVPGAPDSRNWTSSRALGLSVPPGPNSLTASLAPPQLCCVLVFARRLSLGGCGCLFWAFLGPSPTRWQSPYTRNLSYFGRVNPRPCVRLSALLRTGCNTFLTGRCTYVCACACVSDTHNRICANSRVRQDEIC